MKCSQNLGKVKKLFFIPTFKEMSFKIRKYKLSKYLKEAGFSQNNIDEFVKIYGLNKLNHYSKPN